MGDRVPSDSFRGGRQGAAPSARRLAGQAVRSALRGEAADKEKLAIDHRLLMSEVQLLLAEKRTSFALLRTGVTVALVPLSIWTVLLATSRLWSVFDIIWLLVPVMLVALLLFGLGAFLIVRALAQLRHTEQVMMGVRSSDTLIESLVVDEPPAFVRRLPRTRRGKRGARDL